METCYKPRRTPLWEKRSLFAVALLSAWLGACVPFDFFLIHPETQPPGVGTWTEDVVKGELRIHLEWAVPPGEGPFPAVLIHPAADYTAETMKGVSLDLAKRGYVAVAVDYRRWLDEAYRRTPMAWRSEDDARAALALVRADPRVDPRRVATLGFSRGAVLSLLIAAYAPEQVAVVVSYYPVVDFVSWMNQWRPNAVRRFFYRLVRKYFYAASGAQSEEEFRHILTAASPLRQAERIRAAVLLVHGQTDSIASPNESVRLARRLQELGREVKLVLVPGGGHGFNFRDREQGEYAWAITLAWFDRHLNNQKDASRSSD